MGITRTRSPGSLLLRWQVEGGAGRERCTIKEEGEEDVKSGAGGGMNRDQGIDGQVNEVCRKPWERREKKRTCYNTQNHSCTHHASSMKPITNLRTSDEGSC